MMVKSPTDWEKAIRAISYIALAFLHLTSRFLQSRIKKWEKPAAAVSKS
jgi:hypothetical protein